jgi:predicted metal-dependent hydrolase
MVLGKLSVVIDVALDTAADKSDEITEILASLYFDEIWAHATATEQRLLVDDLLDAVRIFADRLRRFRWAGAPRRFW